MDNSQDPLKVYSLEEAKDALLKNKELYEFKLMVSIELEIMIKNMHRSKEPHMYLRNRIQELLSKIENG
jgi:hypothetical protein